ncbi:DUF4363 family protein [Clostridium sp. Sa3CUN1]|uniref:DUF4363 family protein n=1 Tax=Clostridium gallinarum TaxID=2762246 RepID=A0ABR8Q3W9_9CLOT|nr:DUF4363 family protein [Clostridium gallinarum]MBD7915101.1 DUF4363 family protein [Clostridium gallinarum]
MRNSIISVILFIALVIGLFFLNNKFVNLCNEIIVKCDIIEDYLDNYEEDKAYEDSVALIDMIQEEADVPAIYLNHVDYDYLKNDALKLSLYIKGEDRAESLATLHSVRSTAEHLRDLQMPNLKNLL